MIVTWKVAVIIILAFLIVYILFRSFKENVDKKDENLRKEIEEEKKEIEKLRETLKKRSD